jgi:hypothetical protein
MSIAAETYEQFSTAASDTLAKKNATTASGRWYSDAAEERKPSPER